MSDPSIESELNIREKLVHIDQMLADIDHRLAERRRIDVDIDRTLADRRRIDADHDRKRQEIRYAPWPAIFTGMGAGAAFFAAGTAFLKLMGG
jgi:hypothetical protein